MTAVVRHRETRTPMRATTAKQNRLAIHLGYIRDTGSITNFETGTVSVWCETIDGARAVREVACAYGATDIRVTNAGDFTHSGTAVCVEIEFPEGGD